MVNTPWSKTEEKKLELTRERGCRSQHAGRQAGIDVEVLWELWTNQKVHLTGTLRCLTAILLNAERSNGGLELGEAGAEDDDMGRDGMVSEWTLLRLLVSRVSSASWMGWRWVIYLQWHNVRWCMDACNTHTHTRKQTKTRHRYIYICIQ